MIVRALILASAFVTSVASAEGYQPYPYPPAPAPYPPLNAFNPVPPVFNQTFLGAVANTPACGQVPSTGATAAPSVAPVAQVPMPDPGDFKVVTVNQDPNAAGKK